MICFNVNAETKQECIDGCYSEYDSDVIICSATAVACTTAGCLACAAGTGPLAVACCAAAGAACIGYQLTCIDGADNELQSCLDRCDDNHDDSEE